MEFDYDLFVIGGGSGGVRAARIAASEGGAKVALAEEYRMGGTCVIRGCVPKKLMVFASAYPGEIEDARAYGWDAQIGAFDWSRFHAALGKELDRLEGAYTRGLDGAKVEIFHSRAVLEDAHTVRIVETGKTVTAKHILIATGGTPFVPEDIPGHELAITSNEVFLWDEMPKRMLIVGGGYIACEFACILNGLGAEVTQYYRGEQILRGFDREVRDHISAAMASSGIDLRLGTNVTAMEKTETGIRVTATDGTVQDFDAVLYATGRSPNSKGLGLEALGVGIAASGAIEVDDYSQTSVPSIYAVGDVTDRIALTPVAIREGHAFANTVFKGEPTKADHELVASAVFTQPEMGSIGMSEEEAAAAEQIEVYVATFRPMKSLFAGREDKVLMKLIVSQATRRILGCHIVAPEAGEMIQMAAIAIKMGATKEDFDRTVAVHPTMGEELVTLKRPIRKT